MISNPKILLPKGSLVGNKYEIQFPSGSCNFSDSFRAKDTDGNAVRLELINLASLPGSSYDDDGKLRIVELLGLLRHPNIPELLDDGETVIGAHRFAYLAFPFISGESLFELLGRQGVLSPYKVLPIALELLETLDYLHNLDPPVIHNGISLNSIMLDYSTNRDKPIVTGFDQAREIHAPRSSISLKGLSLFHAAPELLHGVFVPQSDLFSVGAVMHHLILGVPPWNDEGVVKAPPDKVKVASADARSKPLNLDLVDECVLDEHFKRALKKALSLSVEDRFQSAEEFARGLKIESQIAGPRVGVVAGSPAERKQKKPGTGFEGIAGMEELKSVLHNEVIRPIVERERFEKFGIPLLNGILLYGPPRCGKTFIAERLVEEVGFNFRKVSPSELGSKWVNEGSEKIARLFRDAAEMAPCIVGSSRVDLQACKLEYSIVSPK